MQIKRLYINKHLCLNDFDISFNTIDGGSSTILIGENGSGKSTMLKALLDIIMSFDSNAIANRIYYDYNLEYVYAQKQISIEKKGRHYDINIDNNNYSGSMETIKGILARNNRIFPQRVIAFYSGSNNRFYDEIKKNNSQYIKRSKKSLLYYINSINNGNHTEPVSIPKRKFIYCDEFFVPIYLCAILAGHDSYEKELIQNECRLSGIKNVDISMNIKNIASFFDNLYLTTREEIQNKIVSLIEYIDYRFVKLFRNRNWTLSGENVYLTIFDMDRLNLDSISILEFFEKLKIFFKAKYVVYAEGKGKIIRDTDLSEGQRQLIKVLGMLGVCKSEDCLVLMDEPDAYMNPRWKYNIKDIIDKVLKPSVNTQAIIATHDPLVINGVSRESIHIFERDSETGFTKVVTPEENTEGMGIDGLLQSEYYGLRTSYDKKTTDAFVRRQELYEKLINKEIDDEEKEELKSLTRRIGSMPVSANTIDFLYDDFIRVFRKTDYYKKEYLSFDEIQKRNKEIEKIISALYEGCV